MNRITDERIELFDSLMINEVDENFRQWLIDNGFFTAPASTKFHGSYPGGLFDHSLNVALELFDLTSKFDLEWERPESPFIIGMFHDLCKIDQYLYNTVTKTYSWNTATKYVGHGDKSVKLLLEHMTLTQEEIDCITEHMGAFTDKAKWPNFTEAIKRHKNVLYTHFADMIASHIIEVDEQKMKE